MVPNTVTHGNIHADVDTDTDTDSDLGSDIIKNTMPCYYWPVNLNL